jgi:L-ascorbate metabolism protein UlaG (beta-lactamase superfamily)
VCTSCRLTVLALLLTILSCAPRIAAPRAAEFRDGGLHVVRGGHATVWIDLNGFRVMTDPLLLGWLYMFPRNEPLGFDRDALPATDLAVISHSHMDHFDPWSLSKLPPGAPVFFPPDSERYHPWIAPRPAFTMDWWAVKEVVSRTGHTARITSVPARHWAGRLGFDGLWNGSYGGWVIESGGYTVYFAGDTGDDPEMFAAIAARFPRIDLALLPIGPISNREPDGRMLRHHINPPGALAAAEILQPTVWMPMHYGAFWQSPRPSSEPLTWLREIMATEAPAIPVALLDPGDVFAMQDPRGPIRIVRLEGVEVIRPSVALHRDPREPTREYPALAIEAREHAAGAN